MLYLEIPKGFFPLQDTGVIQGISEAPQSISFAAMAERQQALGRVILQDPAVASLSSFIGVDGTNVTLNSGRILISLKPLRERRVAAIDVIRRLQPELAKVQGIQLFMQPVQDLTVEDRVSRTQYQYTLEDPDGAELAAWAPRLLASLRALPALRDVSTDQQDQGIGTAIVIDRSTAARLGVTPQVVDDTLYDAFGQRQVSTMFTQVNQYRVVLEVKSDFRQTASGPGQPLRPRSQRRHRAARHADHRDAEKTAPVAISRQGQFPAVTLVVQPGAPARRCGDAVRAIESTTRRARPAGQHRGQLPGHRAGVPGGAGQRARC